MFGWVNKGKGRICVSPQLGYQMKSFWTKNAKQGGSGGQNAGMDL